MKSNLLTCDAARLPGWCEVCRLSSGAASEETPDTKLDSSSSISTRGSATEKCKVKNVLNVSDFSEHTFAE